MDKPIITYPCRWTFTLIGTDPQAVSHNVAECLPTATYRLTSSNKSRTGKYVSLHLDTEVASEEARNRLFARLKAAPAVKMIL
jgi:putative lipoic acid-binding regulatory protein